MVNSGAAKKSSKTRVDRSLLDLSSRKRTLAALWESRARLKRSGLDGRLPLLAPPLLALRSCAGVPSSLALDLGLLLNMMDAWLLLCQEEPVETLPRGGRSASRPPKGRQPLAQGTAALGPRAATGAAPGINSSPEWWRPLSGSPKSSSLSSLSHVPL